jgi:addiction module HigA family antidote
MTELKRKRRPSSPGEILRQLFMEPRDISVSDLAAAVGVSRKHMSQIVNGKARIEPAIAARLGKTLETGAQIWIDLQGEVDAWDAELEIRRWKPRRTFPAAA